MRLETERNIVHLVIGCLLAVFVLQADKSVSLVMVAACMCIGLLVSKGIQIGMKIPLFWHAIKRLEREKTMPGKGTINFFLGAFISLVFFPNYIVFLAVLILSFDDSFSTVVGKAFGRKKLYREKTYVGTVSGFLAALLVTLLFTNPIIAVAACATAAFIELVAVIDDNIFIPIATSLVIYCMIYII